VLAICGGKIRSPVISKRPDDLFASQSPRTDSFIAAAVQWADRIMRKIDKCVWKQVSQRRH